MTDQNIEIVAEEIAAELVRRDRLVIEGDEGVFDAVARATEAIIPILSRWQRCSW